MKNGTKLIAVLLCILLLLPTMAFAETPSSLDAEIAQSAEGMSALSGKKGELLKDQEQFPAGTSVCDWLAMAMALSGAEESYADYLQALKAYVENAYAKNGCLDKNKATEYHRIALTVMALGGDPTSFGVKPDGSAIDLIAEGTYNYARDPGAQGLNGWIWALIALDAQDTEVPADAQYSREDMVSAIVIAQEPDGGFGLIPGKSDVDITAMAVQALAPYQDQLGAEIDAALAGLSGDAPHAGPCQCGGPTDHSSEPLSYGRGHDRQTGLCGRRSFRPPGRRSQRGVPAPGVPPRGRHPSDPLEAVLQAGRADPEGGQPAGEPLPPGVLG
ncbi:MAG: hypothetical protein UF383_08240 [Oscillospiraceae bacterium]|nr:hypothetical protein [Oscillospiraceae bacterium]